MKNFFNFFDLDTFVLIITTIVIAIVFLQHVHAGEVRTVRLNQDRKSVV